MWAMSCTNRMLEEAIAKIRAGEMEGMSEAMIMGAADQAWRACSDPGRLCA